MPKVLLSKLPDAIANTLAALRDGLLNAGGDNIVAKVIDNKIDIQVEVIIDVNGITREQFQSSAGATRTITGGAETTVQNVGEGLTTQNIGESLTTQNIGESLTTQNVGSRTNITSEGGTDTGSESATENSSSWDNSSGSQTTTGTARTDNTYNTN